MSFKFTCYFPAEEPQFFIISVPLLGGFVYEIVRAIYTELTLLRREVNLVDLRLFKTDVLIQPSDSRSSRALEWLQRQPRDSHLIHDQTIASVFPAGPHPSSDKIDIIIADLGVFELVDGLGDPNFRRMRKVKKALDLRLSYLSPTSSPSEIIHSPDRLRNVLRGETIHVGRPGGPPVAIFNSTLATLQHRLEHLEEIEVSPQLIDCASKYLNLAVAFYSDDDERQRAIIDVVNYAIGETVTWGSAIRWADNIKPDACWWNQLFAILLLELKNTPGLSGDALLQAIMDYGKIISGDRYKPFREYTNFPIVLVGVTANRIEISAAVCVGSIYVSRLLTLDLTLGYHPSDNIVSLARVFKALSLSRSELNDYYVKVQEVPFPKAIPKLSIYPNPSPIDPSTTLPSLVYRQFFSHLGQPTSLIMDLGRTTTAMYIATLTDTDQEVVVKFTSRYNEEAHQLLATAGLAPKLYFCRKVIGNLYMVVMEYVNGKSIWELQQEKAPIPAIILGIVRNAITLLHEKDIVFGDLRDPNILYIESKSRALLVDFDWPGVDGKSRYPASLNSKNIWADEVRPYGIMRKAHDLWQLERIKELCTVD